MYAAATSFYERYGMPRCIGAVDGTHIEMIAPRVGEGHYINRHWTHSINVQVKDIKQFI